MTNQNTSTPKEVGRTDDLLPCPFCGTTKGLYPTHHDFGGGKPFAIDCVGCGVDFTPREGIDVVAAWNRRAPTAQTDDLEVREAVSLADCPPGLFLFNGTVGFKSEYGAMETVGPTNVPGPDVRWTVGHQPDAYCADSGEYFWGGAKTHEERAKLIVQPICSEALIARSQPKGAGQSSGEEALKAEIEHLKAENRDLKAIPWPRAYLLERRSEWARLLREIGSYIKTCRGSCGSDMAGRDHAIAAVDEAVAILNATPTDNADGLSADREAVAWAVGRWSAEVENRPLVNKNRRALDDAWRQVIRHFGGNPDQILPLPDHDMMVSEAALKDRA